MKKIQITGGVILVFIAAVVLWVLWTKFKDILPKPRPNEAPASNLFSRLADNATSAITDNPDATVGTAVFDSLQGVKKWFAGLFRPAGQPDYWDAAQAAKTRAALAKQKTATTSTHADSTNPGVTFPVGDSFF